MAPPDPRASLETYLDALSSQTFGRALAASEGAARRLVLVRLILFEHNRQRGATTTVSISGRTFSPSKVGRDRVVFAGRAVLHSAVSGDGEVESSVRELTDPIVERRGSRWVVTSFSWDGRPIVGFEGGASGRSRDVELRLEGSVAFGDVIGVVVLLLADGPRSVRIESDRLRIADVESASGFRTLIGGQPGFLYLTYPRRNERPSSWLASVAVDELPATDVSLAFAT